MSACRNRPLTGSQVLQVTASGAGAGKNPYPSSFTAVINNICPSGNYGDLDLPENKDGRWENPNSAILAILAILSFATHNCQTVPSEHDI